MTVNGNIEQDSPKNIELKESLKNELIEQNIVSPEMIPMLNQLSLKDYEDVFQSEESKSQIAVDDPTDKKKLPTITDQLRKEMEATIWDSEQDLLLQDKMNQDLTPYDREWLPQTREEVQDLMS